MKITPNPLRQPPPSSSLRIHYYTLLITLLYLTPQTSAFHPPLPSSLPTFHRPFNPHLRNILSKPTLNPIYHKPKTTLSVLTTTSSNLDSQSSTPVLDALIDSCVSTTAKDSIIMQFDPSSLSLWKSWKGTIFSETWRTCVRNIIVSAMITALLNGYQMQYSNGVIVKGEGFHILWSQLLSVTTFTLTFFLNTSYQMWRKCYTISRTLQGRLNDIGLTLAVHARRTTSSSSSNSKLIDHGSSSTDIAADTDAGTEITEIKQTTYTIQSRNLLLLISRYIRLFNLLTYASFTRSHRPILTPRGMRRLVDRKLLTHREYTVLTTAEVPATQMHNIVLTWLSRVFVEGRENGHFQGGGGFEGQFLDKIHIIRAQYGFIGDELQGRMPLAYAHIVQVLVDLILVLYPFMGYSCNMSKSLCIVGTGVLTMVYQGLFDLAKQFLDPFDNENYGKGEDPLQVNTFIAETNAGSVRWLKGFEFQPWDVNDIATGEMEGMLLPEKGITSQQAIDNEVSESERQAKVRMEKERVNSELRQMAKGDTFFFGDGLVDKAVKEASLALAESGIVSHEHGHEQGPNSVTDDVYDVKRRLSKLMSDEIEYAVKAGALDEFARLSEERIRVAKRELKVTRAILNAGPMANDLEEGEEEEEIDVEGGGESEVIEGDEEEEGKAGGEEGEGEAREDEIGLNEDGIAAD